MHKNYLAIDIGASSGRHIVGWMENGVLRTEEVYRFPNSVRRVDGHLEWDIDSLFTNVKQGIREAFAKFPEIESLSIDTWAVDYVLLKDGKPLSPVYAYRDSRTQAVLPEVHSILPFAQLYARTGIQFQPFNSIYQLYADKKVGRLAQAEDFLMSIVFTIWTLFCGSIQIRCNDRDFNIEAKGWNDYTVEYSQIDSISYEENVLQNDNGYRTNGLGNLKYAMGNFKNDIFGDYIRYTHASCHSYVVMNIDGKILVVNGENDAETKEIYQRISEKVSKERK